MKSIEITVKMWRDWHASGDYNKWVNDDTDKRDLDDAIRDFYKMSKYQKTNNLTNNF